MRGGGGIGIRFALKPQWLMAVRVQVPLAAQTW